MKNVFFVFVYLVFAVNTSRSELVLARFGPGPADFISMGSNIFSVTFTPAETSMLNSINLSMSNGGLTNSEIIMRFSFNSDLSNYFADTNAAISNSGGPHNIPFALGQGEGPIVGLEQKTIYFRIMSATNGVDLSDFAAMGQTSSEGLVGNWSTGASTSPNFYFVLDATAVPEPSTLTLMFAVLVLLFAIYQVKNFIW